MSNSESHGITWQAYIQEIWFTSNLEMIHGDRYGITWQVYIQEHVMQPLQKLQT